MILAFILDNQLDNARTANSILPELHLSEVWILAKSCLLEVMSNINNSILACLVNGKSTCIERKVHFPQYYKNCWESCFDSKLK